MKYLSLPALLVIFCGSAEAQDRVDSFWVSRLKTEGKAAFESYTVLFKRIDETSETRYEYGQRPDQPSVKPMPSRNDRIRVARIGLNTLVERREVTDGDAKPPRERVECENPVYSFAVSKTSKGEYVVSNYKLGSQQPPLSEQTIGVYASAIEGLSQVLDAIDGRKNFTLNAVQMDADKRLLRIKSTFLIEDKKPMSIQQELWVDPNRCWSTKKLTRDTPSVKFTTEVDYGYTVDGLAMPSRFTNSSVYKVANAPKTMTISGRVESVQLTDLPDDKFRLVAYDLPEPTDAPSVTRPTPTYLWILLAAGVSALMAGGAYYLRSRLAKPHAIR